MSSIFDKSLADAQEALHVFRIDPVGLRTLEEITKVIADAFRANRNLFLAGNGGSHADALHMAEELTGKARKVRNPLGALALGEATHVTCTGNDYGFDCVFSRQLQGLGKAGDVLLVLSTSGESSNLIKAVDIAHEKGIYTIGFLGRNGGKLKSLVDLAVVIPAQDSDRIQEIHMLCLHMIAEQIELLMP